jgi:hypothetical protein
MDPIKQTFWILTSQHLYELLISDEDRYVWEIYLERNDFENALKFAKVFINI